MTDKIHPMNQDRPDKGCCAVCRFWETTANREAEGYQNEGICRRRAPIGIPTLLVDESGMARNDTTYGATVGWPKTFEEDWCGEWECRSDLRGKYKTKATEA